MLAAACTCCLRKVLTLESKCNKIVIVCVGLVGTAGKQRAALLASETVVWPTCLFVCMWALAFNLFLINLSQSYAYSVPWICSSLSHESERISSFTWLCPCLYYYQQKLFYYMHLSSFSFIKNPIGLANVPIQVLIQYPGEMCVDEACLLFWSASFCYPFDRLPPPNSISNFSEMVNSGFIYCLLIS